ncbi:MAG: hypothetical protein WC365_07375, partial [Candidatus Babeliales bacterium]
FELSWLSYLFGRPVDAKAFIDRKLNDPDISADDIYSTVVRFEEKTWICPGRHDITSITGTILIDIVSRPAIRELRIVGEKGMLMWNWDKEFIYFDNENPLQRHQYYVPKGKAAEGYHSSICEEMYISEIANFINAIQGKEQYLYSREDEKAAIAMLGKVEGK